MKHVPRQECNEQKYRVSLIDALTLLDKSNIRFSVPCARSGFSGLESRYRFGTERTVYYTLCRQAEKKIRKCLLRKMALSHCMKYIKFCRSLMPIINHAHFSLYQLSLYLSIHLSISLSFFSSIITVVSLTLIIELHLFINRNTR